MQRLIIAAMLATVLAACSSTPTKEGGAPVEERTPSTGSTDAATSGTTGSNIAGTATAVAGFAAGSTHTPNYISVVGTTTATSGQGTLLQGGGGAGFVQASADF